MTASRGPRVGLMVVFLVLIGIVAPSQVVLELCQGEMPQIAELFQQAPTRTNLKRLESNLERRCQLAQAVRPWTQYVRFVLFEDAGDQAVLGRSGWFFYKPAVQYLVEPCPLANASTRARSVPVRASSQTPYGVTTNESDILTAIVSFRDELAKRSIKLIVMPAPNKASIYPERLTDRADGSSAPANPTTRAVLAQLKEAGVEVIDLFEVYGEARLRPGSPEYYLAQDSHWSPEGMRLAAETVAQRLLDSAWVQKGPVKYETKPVTLERYGDVLRMIRVTQIERHFRPERVDCTQVIDTQTGKPYADDPNAPVLVLGDSFLRIFERDEPGSGGFIAHLARNLGFGLTSLVNDGGASTLVRQQLARKPALLKGKKVVIWEFVERDIRFGTEGWQVIPLP